MDEARERDLQARERGERNEGQDAPEKSDLAIVVMPQAGIEERPGGDRQEQADERQRPRRREPRAVDRRRSVGGSDSDEEGETPENECANDGVPIELKCRPEFSALPPPAKSARKRQRVPVRPIVAAC